MNQDNKQKPKINIKFILFILFIIITSLVTGFLSGRYVYQYNLSRLEIVKQTCIEQGGTWRTVGIINVEKCVLPTHDGGKICTDDNECEAECKPELTDEQIKNFGAGETVYAKGKCYDWKLGGCGGYTLKEGKIDDFSVCD